MGGYLLGFHRVQMLTTNTGISPAFYWEKLPKRKVLGNFQAPVNYRRNITYTFSGHEVKKFGGLDEHTELFSEAFRIK